MNAPSHIVFCRSRRARVWLYRVQGFAACAFLALLWVVSA